MVTPRDYKFAALHGAVYAPVPHKFEAGTVNAGGAAALAEAIRYYDQIGFETIRKQEELLTQITPEEKEQLEEAGILEDISHMPSRVKCAVLGWRTMEEVLKKCNT